MTKAIIETAPAEEAVSVPATLRDSLIARLDVSPATKAAAQIASCIGRDFDEALVLSITDIAPVELQEGLPPCCRPGSSSLRPAGASGSSTRSSATSRTKLC